MNEIGFEKKDQ